MITAGQQGKPFDFAEILYENQGTENTGWLDDAMVAQAAERVPGLNPRQLFAARDSDAVRTQASTFEQQAAAAGVRATPTLYSGKSGKPAKDVNGGYSG